MSARVLPLACRSLSEPALCRLALDHPLREKIVAEHDAAMAGGRTGYVDPQTGLFVLTAAWLADRGTCCGNRCRHCPYVVDEEAP